MENSKIEWCTHTMNPWIGCQHVSAGCDNCFAEALMDKRYGKVEWGPHGERKRTSEDYWKQPLRWARKHRQELAEYEEIVRLTPKFGEHSLPPSRPRVFCASLADVFDNQVPPEWRADLFDLILRTPELDWLLLTKRPENIAKMLPASPDPGWPWPNIWFGTTCEDQTAFDRRWPILREVPAWIRFISYEPALGPLHIFSNGAPIGLSWLICGGESGGNHRPMDQRWANDVRNDCARAGIAYFFKQMAGKKPIPDQLLIRQFPNQGKTP